MTTTKQATHACGLCDGPLVYDGDCGGHDTWLCADSECGWWHISIDCCEPEVLVL